MNLSAFSILFPACCTYSKDWKCTYTNDSKLGLLDMTKLFSGQALIRESSWIEVHFLLSLSSICQRKRGLSNWSLEKYWALLQLLSFLLLHARCRVEGTFLHLYSYIRHTPIYDKSLSRRLSSYEESAKISSKIAPCGGYSFSRNNQDKINFWSDWKVLESKQRPPRSRGYYLLRQALLMGESRRSFRLEYKRRCVESLAW